jgi:ribosomal protein L11 methyltransferase
LEYRRTVFRLPAALEEPFSAALWEAGTLGLEIAPAAPAGVTILAYFPAGPSPAPGLLGEGGWREQGVELAADGEEAATDWLASYRARVQPFAVGRTLFVDPREPGQGEAAVAPADRRLLVLPARAAFGTGSHESTRLVLELMEEIDWSGRDVLDVGTGTGVLSFAALLFGARAAVAFDVDPAAPVHARDNGRLNRLPLALFAGPLAALRPGPRFDAALVNVVPEEIAGDLAGLLELLRPGAEVVFSGILAEKGAGVIGPLAELGLEPVASREDGEWIAFRTAWTGGPQRRQAPGA